MPPLEPHLPRTDPEQRLIAQCISRDRYQPVREGITHEISRNVALIILGCYPGSLGRIPRRLTAAIVAKHRGGRRIEDSRARTNYQLIRDLVGEAEPWTEVQIVRFPLGAAATVDTGEFKGTGNCRPVGSADRVHRFRVEVGNPVVTLRCRTLILIPQGCEERKPVRGTPVVLCV